MNQNFQHGNEMPQGHEETLRLLAQIPPPEELADRVHRRLSVERFTGSEQRRFWSLWRPAQRLQFAAAALLAVAVAASSWSVYRSHSQPDRAGAHNTQPMPAADSNSGFGTAGAVRVPPTLAPIKVPPVLKKKAANGHKLAKPSPEKLAARQSTASAGSGSSGYKP